MYPFPRYEKKYTKTGVFEQGFYISDDDTVISLPYMGKSIKLFINNSYKEFTFKRTK